MEKWIAAVALMGLTACGGGEGDDAEQIRLDQPQEQSQDARADWPEGLAAEVDDANTAYAEGRYEDAAGMYRQMTADHPDIGTLWFGLYLSESALGNDEAAEAALEKVEEMVPGLLQMHDQAESGQMPGMGGAPMDSIHAPMMDGGG